MSLSRLLLGHPNLNVAEVSYIVRLNSSSKVLPIITPSSLRWTRTKLIPVKLRDDNWTSFAQTLAIYATPLRAIYLLSSGSSVRVRPGTPENPDLAHNRSINRPLSRGAVFLFGESAPLPSCRDSIVKRQLSYCNSVAACLTEEMSYTFGTNYPLIY